MYVLSYSAGLKGTLGDIQQVAAGSGQSGYACTSSFCYTSGAQYSGLFQKLQGLLNLVAQMKGINSKVTVDGKLGASTLTLAKAIANKIKSTEVPKLWQLASLEGGNRFTKEYFAKYSEAITSDLEMFAYGKSAPYVATSDIYTGAGGTVPGGIGPGGSPPAPPVTPPVYPNVNLPAVPGISPWGIRTDANGYPVNVSSSGPNVNIPNSSIPYGPFSVNISSPFSSPLVLVGIGILGLGIIAAIVTSSNKKKRWEY